MHYSPFSAGIGLMAISRLPIGASPFAFLARLLLDLAGAGFLLLGLFFLLANLYGALASRLGPSTGRHRRGGTGPRRLEAAS